MADVTPACFPPPEATNKLASLKHKALKAHVAFPFPMVELSEFLPTWANDTPPLLDGGAAPKKTSRYMLFPHLSHYVVGAFVFVVWSGWTW